MRLLVVEDENDLREVVAEYLGAAGYDVDTAENGKVGLDKAIQTAYDAIIMDIMMPVMDGLEALAKMREKNVLSPILLLTAKSELDDKIQGLDAGADDYLTKPFAMKELLARVRSMTRRKEEYIPKKLEVGNATLHIEDSMLSSTNSVSLSTKENHLMKLLILNKDRDITIEEIIEKIWDNDADTDTVEVYVNFLNSKLKSIGADTRIKEKEHTYCMITGEYYG